MTAPSKDEIQLLQAWARNNKGNIPAVVFDILFTVAGMRCRTVDPDLLRRMKESGCVSVYYGMESGSQRILDVMEKNSQVQHNANAVRWTAEAGLSCELCDGGRRRMPLMCVATRASGATLRMPSATAESSFASCGQTCSASHAARSSSLS